LQVLLSTIGSRGDVQPLVALAVGLRDLGHGVRLCVPPDFRGWIEGRGFPVVPIGPELRGIAHAGQNAAPPTPEQRRQMMDGTVAAQFATIMAAAEGCDAIVGATALQIAAPSVAEKLGIPYVFAAYCPAVLPSLHHAPLPQGWSADGAASSAAQWAADARRWNEDWGPALNGHRAALGLAPVVDVRGYVLTDRPWLAADPALAPWPEPGDGAVVQTGAWILPDARPLTPALEAFLDAGDPPVYLGFGSARAPEGIGPATIEAARAFGRRVVASRGWADLSLPDAGRDCLLIDEVNQQALFRRVAAVVHHGGAGTTTAAARAGVPQVVVPQGYDQPYWAQRVRDLGIGTTHAPGAPTAESLAAALAAALRPEVAMRAGVFADLVLDDGARVAARRLVDDIVREPSLSAPRSGIGFGPE
jgi:vancomycin aglycone glucosyltransferase